MAVYIRRPRFDEERLSRGMPSQLHASDYFFLFEIHFIVDDENEQMVSITETENKYEGDIA